MIGSTGRFKLVWESHMGQGSASVDLGKCASCGDIEDVSALISSAKSLSIIVKALEAERAKEKCGG